MPLNLIKPRRMKSSRALLTVAAGLTAVFAATPVFAEVEAEIPADAVMVVRFNDLTQTSQKLGKLFQDLGITGFDPRFEDPLGAVREMSQIQEGLDAAGDAAFVVMPFDNEPTDNAFILVPVSDYKAFLGNFHAEVGDNGIAEGKSNDGKTLYVLQRGDYAAITPEQGVLENMPEGKLKTSGLSGKSFADQDVVLYANFDKIGALVMPDLQDGKDEITNEMTEKLADGENAKFQPIAEAAINQAFAVAETFLKETDATTLGLTFGESGINVKILADFKADSYLAKNLGNLKGTDASLLAGLPEMNYFMFGGSTNNPDATVKVFNDVIGPVKEAAQGVEDEKITLALDYLDAIESAVKNTKGQTFGILSPQGDLGVDPLIQFVSVTDGDGEALKEATTKIQSLQQDVMKEFAAMSGTAAQMPQIKFEEDAKTLAGVTFDKITQEPTSNGPETMIFGPEGMVQYFGVVNGKMVTFSGLTDADAETFIGSIKAGADPLVDSAGVANVAKQLPNERLGVMYIRLDEIVRTVGDTAQQFGAQVQVNMPPDLAPLGVTFSSGQDALIIDAYMPGDTLQALVAQGMQTYMQMQGGGRGAGGGL